VYNEEFHNIYSSPYIKARTGTGYGVVAELYLWTKAAEFFDKIRNYRLLKDALLWIFFSRAPQQKLRTHRSLKASCATMWWRWEKDDQFFFIFPSNGAPVKWNWQGKTEVLEETPVPVPLCPPQIPHGLTRDRTRASAVEGRRLTAWAMARPPMELVSTRRFRIVSHKQNKTVLEYSLVLVSVTDQV
jgi:hypothetical protein